MSSDVDAPPPSLFPGLAGLVEQTEDGCWRWIGKRRRLHAIRGKPGKRYRAPITAEYYVRVACGLTRTGWGSKRTCGTVGCVHPHHWRTKPQPRRVRVHWPTKLTPEIAEAIREEYRKLWRAIVDDYGSKAKADRALRRAGDRRVHEFFDRMVERYKIGRSTARHAAYGTRGGVKKPPGDDAGGVSKS